MLTTGAGVAVPFAWVARLRGAKVVYVESLARIEGPSLTYRLIAPIAERRYVQWPELARLLPGSRFAGNVFSAESMIFVSVGTNEARFDRLLGAVGALSIDEAVVVQHGHSSATLAPDAEVVDFLPFEEMDTTIRRARAFVTHAGVGSIMVALANGKRPIVVPRRKAFGEAVDDHQLQLGRRFAEAGLVTLVEDPDGLGEALAQEQVRAAVAQEASPLAAELLRFLEHAIASPVPV